MERSERIEELAVALAAAQGEFRPAQKSGKNPHLRNRYATLDDIIEAIREPLQAHGLSFLQLLDGPDLTTMLLHESGQWISARATIESLEGNRGTNDMQAFGATLTYLKRYALAAMLGISSDEDVDGEVKRPQKKTTTQKKPPQGNGNEQKEMRPYSPETVRKGLQQRIKKHGSDELAPQSKRGAVCGALEDLFADADEDIKQAKRYSLLKYLVGKDTSKTLTDAEARALLYWASDKVEDDGGEIWVPDSNAVQEAAKIIEAVDVAAGQESLEI